MTNEESKAGPQSAPEDKDNAEREATAIAQSGRQSAEDAAKERASVQPKVGIGPGSGSRLVDRDGNAVSALDHDKDGETLVTVKDDVYEEFAAPGAPNRKIKRLLFHSGQRVPLSTLKRHEDALKRNSDEAARLEKLGRGTGHPKDADLAGEGETKDDEASEVKEGARGRVSRRS